MSTVAKVSKVLIDKKVKLEPITRQGKWLPPGHDGHFMYTGAKMNVCVPHNLSSKSLEDPLRDLSEEQVAELAERLSMKPEDFNVYKKKDNYWLNFEFYVDRAGLTIDLSNPVDFLKYKVCLTNKELIAPSWEERFNRGTYRFAIVDEEHEVEKAVVKEQDKKSRDRCCY